MMHEETVYQASEQVKWDWNRSRRDSFLDIQNLPLQRSTCFTIRLSDTSTRSVNRFANDQG